MTLKQYALLITYVIVFFGGAYHVGNLIMPLKPPMRDAQEQYQFNLGASISPPFLYKYYVFKPEYYDPQKSYPLILLLHGASRHMKSTNFLISEEFQSLQQSFVIVPIAPPQFDWGKPKGSLVSALPLAINSVKAVKRKYNIDPKRVYVSGYSMGGYGTFNAVLKRPDIFAAGMPLCAGWNADDLNAMSTVPLWMFHGAKDSIIPVSASRDFYQAAQAAGMKNIFYQELPRHGHNIWDVVYGMPDSWVWLLSQRKR